MKVTVIPDEGGRPIIYRMTDDGEIAERLSLPAGAWTPGTSKENE